MPGFQVFSFRKNSSTNSDIFSSGRNDSFYPETAQRAQLPLKYRHQASQHFSERVIKYNSGLTINKNIQKISEELQENIRRKHQLQEQLQKKKMIKKMQYNKISSEQEAGKLPELQASEMSEAIKILQADQKDCQLEEIHKNFNFKSAILQPWHINAQEDNSILLKTQIRLQKLLQVATFPEIPKVGLQKLLKDSQTLLALSKPHSDMYLLCMIASFHLRKFTQVCIYFKEVQNFKMFNAKAYWIAAEAKFALQNYSHVIPLAQKCMETLPERILPRLIYLQAKSHQELGKYIPSLVCYNQLIRLCPKIPEYYLERAVIEDLIGYQRNAKQDLLMFGSLCPEAIQFLKEKIYYEKNQFKKKAYFSILGKIC